MSIDYNQYTEEQKTILENITKSIIEKHKSGSFHILTLIGAAGTGKTTITKEIVNVLLLEGMSIVGVAPTHKARKTLGGIVNQVQKISKIETITIASLLSKFKKHSYVGNKNFTHSTDDKFQIYNLFIIDECSMITKEDFYDIAKYTAKLNKIVLFIGDKFQIPHPTQEYQIKEIENEKYLVKKDSPAFNVKEKYELTEIIRQKGNPIIDLYDDIRNDIYKELPYSRETNVVNIKTDEKIYNILPENVIETKGVVFTNDYDNFNDFIERIYSGILLRDIPDYRIICYTNANVNKYNTVVRKILNFDSIFPQKGELLMGYENVGYPIRTIENGEDYIVSNTKFTDQHKINYIDGKIRKSFENVVGYFVYIKTIGENRKKRLFFPDLYHKNNFQLIEFLWELSENVNQKYSKTKDFVKYSKLKNKLFFIKNVYKFNDEYYLEDELKTKHPLLFKNISNTITNEILLEDFMELYEDVYYSRIEDNKQITQNELFVDRYQMINKDLDFGYSITAHKAQGSTYNTCFVDENDFEKLRNEYNTRLKCLEFKTKEKNQLKYVAFTRPRNLLLVYYQD